MEREETGKLVHIITDSETLKQELKREFPASLCHKAKALCLTNGKFSGQLKLYVFHKLPLEKIEPMLKKSDAKYTVFDLSLNELFSNYDNPEESAFSC